MLLVIYRRRHGKTTLLRHIQSRSLQIPPNIDVLLCEQEVVADETSAVNSVLKSDKKRLALLEEEKRLLEHDDSDAGHERLKEVSEILILYYLIGSCRLIMPS